MRNRDEDGREIGPEALPADHDTFFCDRCFGYHASVECPPERPRPKRRRKVLR